MIIGGVYAKVSQDDHQAIPIFVNEAYKLVGFEQLTAREMVWVIGWYGKYAPDPVEGIIKFKTREFLYLFDSLYVPDKRYIWSSPYLEVAVFIPYLKYAPVIVASLRQQINEKISERVDPTTFEL